MSIVLLEIIVIALYIQGAVAKAIERDVAATKALVEQEKFKTFLGCSLVVRDDEIFAAVTSTKEGRREVEFI